MSNFVLKIVAIISMLFDHSGYVIFNKFSNFNYIGRLAFPIFAFGIGQGYTHTKNLKKYFLRLFVFALISQIPFQLFLVSIGSGFSLNIFFTLILGLFSIYLYDFFKDNKLLAFLSVIALGIISESLQCDYGWYGIAIIFIFYIFRNNKLLMNISFIICTLIKYLINLYSNFHIAYIYLFAFTCYSLFFINSYNGKKGKDTKYILYLFYPIHLLLLYLINM